MSEFWSTLFSSIGSFFNGAAITAPIWGGLLKIWLAVSGFLAEFFLSIVSAIIG